MAKKSTAQGEVSLSIEIKGQFAHYSFSEGLRRDAQAKPATEHVTLWLFGDVVSPDAKRGRDMQIDVMESDHATRAIDPEGPVIGNVSWGARRTASVYVPPGSLWHLAHGVQSGLFTRLQLLLAGPIRGTVDVRGMHMLTRELTLAGFGEPNT